MARAAEEQRRRDEVKAELQKMQRAHAEAQKQRRRTGPEATAKIGKWYSLVISKRCSYEILEFC